MSRWRIVCVLGILAGVCLADTTHDLQLAARSGNLGEVKRLVESGVPVDVKNEWGTTPLLLAAINNQVDVAKYLLEKGADPSARESFFGGTALEMALWKGGPEFEIAKLLLAAGATDRAAAIAQGLDYPGDLELAELAAASGPVLESEAADLRARFSNAEALAILSSLEIVPDPPPPTYSAQQLQDFVGRFEAPDRRVAAVELRDGQLIFGLEGNLTRLVAVRDRVFTDEEGKIVVEYYGRAGGIEGIQLKLPDREPARMRIADDSPTVAVSDLPQYDAAVVVEPTVHWPGFRGANRDGIGDGADTAVDFDLESGEGIAWRTDLPGLGNSSPVVWGDRVYVTTAVAAGGSVPLRVGLTGAGDEIEEDSEHRWLLLALDKATGKQVWETEVGRGVPLTNRHFKATQANSSPVTDGDHIVVVFPTAGLACIGNDGKIHWKHELGGLNAGGFNDPGMQWGFAASPIIHDGKVILQVDIHGGAYIAAWDLLTGKQLWKTERPDVAPSWATPAIWSTENGTELVVNASIIRGYDPDTGRELWSLGPTSIQVVASPVVGPDELIVSSGYPPARPIYAVKPGIRGDHTIESDEDAAPLAWYQSRGGAYMPTPLLYRGLLYMVHHNARIVAHDARSGAPVYKARLSAGGTCTASPVVANGKIYQGTEEGTLYVIEAGPDPRELAVHEFGAPLMATPAISEGLLLIRTPDELIALAPGVEEEEEDEDEGTE